MIQLTVPDMTCGHCVSTITRALKDADPQAKVEVSLADKCIRVESKLPAQDITQRITEAGYTPEATV